MKCFVITLFLACIAVLVPSPVIAAEDLPVRILRQTDCDQRAPRVAMTIKSDAERIGYGPAQSDEIYWLAKGSANAGTLTVTLPRQPFGSTREWVMLVGYKGDQGLTTSRTLTFKRPARAECVARRVVQLDTFRTGINTACPAGSDTLYLVTVRVPRGTPGYIVRTGTASVMQRNGTELRSGGGYIVPPAERKAEFYIFAGRRSRLQLDDSLNQARLTTSSDRVTLVSSVYRTCNEHIA